MINPTYTVVLTPAPEGGYVATVPCLPAVITEGDTYEEAISMAQEAIGVYIESLIERGLQVPVETQDSRPVVVSVSAQLPGAA